MREDESDKKSKCAAEFLGFLDKRWTDLEWPLALTLTPTHVLTHTYTRTQIHTRTSQIPPLSLSSMYCA